ncbi:hypothetical protein B0H16DRAFT_106561 [Mycena metata]|uniref:Uncharacterized protein n=1 Tax=Mycena metata TaxID=1033252 RepID=A0AAD7I8C0_9AGAR|nr:hypothetical protein B0H16DRAFT_106561 [Mycena metata]
MMMKFSFFVLQAAAALTAVTAASIRRDNSSSSCTSALQSIVTSSDPSFGCLAPSALKEVFALGTSNPSAAEFESTLNNWFTDFCGVGTCTSDTIDKLSATVDTPCGIEFNMTDYTQLRELLCLKDTAANTFCTAETLFSGNDTDTGMSVNTTNSTADPGEILFTILLVSTPFFTPCNECAKAQYQLSVQQGGADTSTLDHCGANFTATLNSTLVGVKQVAVTSEFKANAARALAPTAGLLLLSMAGFVSLV